MRVEVSRKDLIVSGQLLELLDDMEAIAKCRDRMNLHPETRQAVAQLLCGFYASDKTVTTLGGIS